jgi:hypothetical protein
MFNDGEIGYEKANAPEFIHSIVQSAIRKEGSHFCCIVDSKLFKWIHYYISRRRKRNEIYYNNTNTVAHAAVENHQKV